MLGGTSHVESFDPKPALNQYAGKTIDETPHKTAVLDSPFYRKNVRDFAGTPRPVSAASGAWDVGAYEFGASAPTASAAPANPQGLRIH